MWLPDSKQIAYGWDVYHLTGATFHLPSSIRGRILSFSPDGRFFYSEESVSPDSSAIVKYDRSHREKSRLLILTGQGHNNARISPDGNLLIYIKYGTLDKDWHVYTPSDSLMAIDLKTGKEKLLAHLNIKFTGRFLDQMHYCFSKDSKYLYIGYGGKIHRIQIETGKNNIIPFTANVKVDMGALDYHRFPVSLDSLHVKYIRSASKSPAGKHLIFSALNRVYVMDLPNGKPRVLIDQPFNQFEPTYSTDGKWICYGSWSERRAGLRIPSAGGKPEKITSAAGLYMNPSWSPDGKRIVLMKGKNKLGGRSDPGLGQLQVITVKDGIVKVIADQIPLLNKAVFAKSGEQIVFKSNRHGGDKSWPFFVSKDIESNAETPLAFVKDQQGEFAAEVRQGVLSPDGQYLAFIYNENLYLSPIANIGGVQNIYDDNTRAPLIRFAKGAIDPVWEENGRVLSWIIGDHYYSINPDKIIEAAEHIQPTQTINGLPETNIIDVDIPADQVNRIDLKVSRKYGSGFIALKNARIITMQGNEVIESGTLLIKDGRIVRVGENNKVIIPNGVSIFDVCGKTIMPGLIDMHSHMYESVPVDVFLQQSWERLLEFSYGVTTMRDPSGSFDTFGYGELVETGQAIGPRLFTVG